MSWFLAFAGFSALIVLHELGHFTAAKAVGMRVERFSLFFGRTPLRFRRGETEYGIGWIPAGGFVKISGMNPNEVLPVGQEHRAYFRQPVWKRIVVIAAGPLVNVIVAFVLLWGLFVLRGEPTPQIAAVQPGSPAAVALRPGDKVLSVDGVTSPSGVSAQIASHRCPGTPRPGCRAATPARFEILRDGQRRRLDLRPVYDTTVRPARTRVGFTIETGYLPLGAGAATSQATSTMGEITSKTLSIFSRIFRAEERKQLSGIVGSYEVTRQAFRLDLATAIGLLALISLSLAIVNLFPFLPLDGGHIFWALAEKVRGRPIPFRWLEASSAVGFALVMVIFVIGFSNDLGRLQDGGFSLGGR